MANHLSLGLQETNFAFGKEPCWLGSPCYDDCITILASGNLASGMLMKRFLRTVVLLVMAMGLEPMGMGAQSIVPNLSAKSAVGAFADFHISEGLLIEDGNSSVKAHIKSPELSMKDAFQQTRKTPMREMGNENQVTIRFTGDVDRDNGREPYIRFRDKDNFYVTGDILFSVAEVSLNTFVYTVPSSVYDIQIGWAEHEPAAVDKHNCFIVWEGIIIGEDQEFVVSREDAPNSVRFNFQLPNGDTPKWPGVMQDESGNLVRDWTGANVGETRSATIVCHPDYGPLQNDGIIFNGSSDGSLMDAFNPEKTCMIWVNDLSEDMWITQHISMNSEHGEIYSSMASTKIKPGENIVEVGCDGYYELGEELVHTPFAFSEIGGSDAYAYTIDELVMNFPGIAYQFKIPGGDDVSLYVKNEPYEIEGSNLTYTPITVTKYDGEHGSFI